MLENRLVGYFQSRPGVFNQFWQNNKLTCSESVTRGGLDLPHPSPPLKLRVRGKRGGLGGI